MVYFVTTASLMITVALCVLVGRRGLSSFGWKQWALRVVAALPLLASGPLHFIHTALLASIIPPFFPYRPQLVLFTGVLELAGAIGLLLPTFTRLASACLAVLMIAIFPANVYGANQTVGGLHLPSVPVRLAMQVLYIVLGFIGWWQWLHGGPARVKLVVGPSPLWVLVSCVGFVTLGTWGLTLALGAAHDIAPFWDALTTCLSLSAQGLLNWKKIENWYFWIAADLIYVPLYVVKRLDLTAIVYVLFLTMCFMGLREWRSMKSQQRNSLLRGVQAVKVDLL